MCDLMTGLMVASTAMGAASALTAGNAEAAAHRSEAKMADANRQFLNLRIADEQQLSAIEGGRIGKDAAEVIGNQEVYGAAGNVDMTFGSPLRAITQSAAAASRDAGYNADNTMRVIRDIRGEQANLKTSANTSRVNAKAAKTGGRMAALGTVISGVSGIGSYRAKNELTREWNIGRAKVKF